MINLGNRLKELRTSKALSLRELAEICGTSKSAISMYERGERRPKYETLEILSKTFDVDIEYLLGKTEKKRRFKIGSRIKQTIAKNIKHHRELNGLTQKQLADMIGSSEKTILDIEVGAIMPDAELLNLIANALGTFIEILDGSVTDEEKLPIEDELSEDVIIYHRDGKTVKKQFTKEQMDMLLAMINAIPEKPKDI